MKRSLKACPGSHGSQEHGFSLLELLIVVAIILIIASIAIPQYLKSRITANEAAAAAAMRAIATCNVLYSSTYQAGFAPTLAAFGPGNPPSPAAADLVDAALASGTRNGYRFLYAPQGANNEEFTANANPLTVGVTGNRYFFIDQTNVLRFNIGAPADANSAPAPSVF